MMIPARGRAFIRHIEVEEHYPGSLIVITPKSQDQVTRCQFEIVRMGNYLICKDEDCERPHTKSHEHRHHLKEGDWVLCRNRTWMETLEPGIFVIWADDILGRFVDK